MKPILLPALKWAAIGGLSLIILNTLLLMTGLAMKGGGWNYVVYLPLIFTMIYGGITIRRESEGPFTFGNAFLAVFLIGLIGSLMLNVYVYQIWAKFVDPDFIHKILDVSAAKIREQAEQKGVSDENVDKQIAFVQKLPFELIGYGVSVFCSLVFGLVISAFVARGDNRPPVKPAE